MPIRQRLLAPTVSTWAQWGPSSPLGCHLEPLGGTGEAHRGCAGAADPRAHRGVPVPHVELAASSGEMGSSWPGANDTTSAAATGVVKYVGEARPPGIAQHSASTESENAVSSGEVGSCRPGADDTTSAAATAAAKSVDEARPPGIAKHSATTESELEESSDEDGPSRHRSRRQGARDGWSWAKDDWSWRW